MTSRSKRESEEPALWTLQELAERASVSVSMLRRLIWSGALQAVKVGRIVRVRSEDFEAYLEAHRTTSRPNLPIQRHR